jgi:hypothetical protein
MPRSVPEWVSDNPDASVPPRVGLRIWRAQDGVCGICKTKILPGTAKHLHHRTALILGGRHAESNLVWVHAACNAAEAKREVAERAATNARAKSHLGIKAKPVRGLPGRTKEEREADRQARAAGKLPRLPPRSIYVETR